MSQIQSALQILFTKHRIVFWYDAKRELRAEFEALLLPGVEAIELNQNEFAVKHRILRQQPEQKFLLYRAGPPPGDLENWLLDVQLAQGEFRADQAGLWLSELGLGMEFLEVVQAHPGFFQIEERRSVLKALLKSDDTLSAMRLKMAAVCCKTEARIDEILEALLDELAEGQTTRIDLIQVSDLGAFLWERVKRDFGYTSKKPGIQDFAIELFKSCYHLALGEDAQLNNDALVFIKRWKDSIRHHPAFEALSAQYAGILNIQTDLLSRETRELVEIDLFEIVDQKILSELAHGVTQRTLTSDQCSAIIRQRRQGHWYNQYMHLYEALQYAAQFIQTLDTADLSASALGEGVQRYTQTWYRLDQLYRKVIFHARKAGHVSVLESLVERVENLYSNNYLLPLNNHWQGAVDACPSWEAQAYTAQSGFFEKWVQPFLLNKKKVYVIISDALRYEIGEEFLGRVRYEDRYEAELSAALAMLPSYTQLGMAALLPNSQLQFVEDESGTVSVDGLSSAGTPNRDKILKQATGGHAVAIRAEELLAMTRDDLRALVRDHEVTYIYHNRIDSTGDKKELEERVFEAVEDTLDELLTIVKKLTAANATNLLVTADHGFIYQNRPIEDSDFLDAEAKGDPVLYTDRRFILGKGLKPHPGLRKFSAAQVGLAGDVEIQIPKSITRLRIKGAGSRYVHGGAALQEVVLPVIQINKKRESDTSQVEVDILRGSSTIITTGQHSVVFYQNEPVSEKVHERRLLAGIYTQDNELISDQHELFFDLASENARQREISVRFILSSTANKANNQEVILRLDEQIPNTSHFVEYKSARYTLRRSFTSDF